MGPDRSAGERVDRLGPAPIGTPTPGPSPQGGGEQTVRDRARLLTECAEHLQQAADRLARLARIALGEEGR